MTYDQFGNLVPDEQPTLGAATSDQYSFGSALWELFHPGQVQAEQTAIGAPVQSTTDVLLSAAQEAASAAQESASNVAASAASIGSGVTDLAKYLAIGAVAIVALMIIGKLPKR